MVNFLKFLATSIGVIFVVSTYVFIIYLCRHYGLEDYSEYFEELNKTED